MRIFRIFPEFPDFYTQIPTYRYYSKEHVFDFYVCWGVKDSFALLYSQTPTKKFLEGCVGGARMTSLAPVLLPLTLYIRIIRLSDMALIKFDCRQYLKIRNFRFQGNSNPQ